MGFACGHVVLKFHGNKAEEGIGKMVKRGLKRIEERSKTSSED